MKKARVVAKYVCYYAICGVIGFLAATVVAKIGEANEIA